jgi:hypothetical protein
MSLSGFLHYVALFLVCGGGGLAAFFVLWVAELLGKLRRRLRRNKRLRLEQYRAEQALHNIRRDAIHDMLETARTYRDTYDGIIEGTAVEVER